LCPIRRGSRGAAEGGGAVIEPFPVYAIIKDYYFFYVTEKVG
jgi:hypothetical protein